MSPKKIKEFLFDESADIQKRLFVLVSVISLGALCMAFVESILIGEDFIDLMVIALAFFVCVSIVSAAIKYDKLIPAAYSIAVVLIFILLPGSFFSGGGIHGGTPLWCVFCALYLSMVLKGRARNILLTCEAVVVMVCYYIGYNYPELVAKHTIFMAYLDSFVSLVLVSFMTTVLVGFEVSVYRKKNKRSEEQREEIDALVQAQNRFFSSMSHEIRTPINTIIGLNEMILREDISDEVAEDANNIQAASKMLLQLINDILDKSKLESGKMVITPVKYNIGDMLSDIVGMMWIRAKEKGLDFHVEVDPSVPAELVGDEVRIKQMVINLLTNAIKYTKEGSVTLSIQAEPINELEALISFSVMDTGMGIKKENIPHLFSAFRRVDESKNRYIEGTGLGLSIVKQFADLMDGQITVNSVYTQGSTFVLKIPQEITVWRKVGELNIERTHAMNRKSTYYRSFEAPDARVLVVDDTNANLLVVTKLLRDTKVQIDTADSGEKALKMTLEKKYHVILMDHLMPEMDGIECMHRVRDQIGGRSKEAKITALTANAGSDVRELYIKEGFDGYITKPVSGEVLEAELIRLLPDSLIHQAENVSEAVDESLTYTNDQRIRIPLLITTESVCDIPKSMLKSRNIPVIPYSIHTDEGCFKDGVEIDSRGFIRYTRTGNGSLRSEPPSVEEYEAFFAKQLIRANNIIHISLAKNVNEAYNIATEGAKAFGNVTVYDSRHLSSGMGLAVLAASDMAGKGMTPDKIVSELNDICNHINTSFIVEDLDYLVKAGRVKEGLARIAGAFMVHPVLALKKSKMGVDRTYFGSRERCWRKYIENTLNTRNEIDRSLLFVTYVGLDKNELELIEREIKKHVEFEKIIFQKASPSISSNCGIGTYGLLFRTFALPLH